MLTSFKIGNLIQKSPLLMAVYTISKKENKSYNDMLEDMVSVLHEAREGVIEEIKSINPDKYKLKNLGEG
jgi:hypothetical protein